MIVFPALIDQIFMYPYQILDNTLLAFWFGTSCLALFCVILGKITSTILYRLNQSYHEKENNELSRLHELSIKAANTGDKELFKDVNRLAQESFGKNFFLGATLFTASIWPLPFALSWMSKHFAGITIHTIPWFDKELGYIFVMFSSYIIIRIIFSKIIKKFTKNK